MLTNKQLSDLSDQQLKDLIFAGGLERARRNRPESNQTLPDDQMFEYGTPFQTGVSNVKFALQKTDALTQQGLPAAFTRRIRMSAPSIDGSCP